MMINDHVDDHDVGGGRWIVGVKTGRMVNWTIGEVADAEQMMESARGQWSELGQRTCLTLGLSVCETTCLMYREISVYSDPKKVQRMNGFTLTVTIDLTTPEEV